MEIKTYCKRTNARRAGVQSGLTTEHIAITVHKNGGEVRFGWRALEVKETPTIDKKEKLYEHSKPIAQKNKIRPAIGSVSRSIWDWLDMNPAASLGQARNVAGFQNWNANTLIRQFYQWRKFRDNLPKSL
jgi:hypothetical protein